MRADPEHLIVLPEGLSPHQAATLGTAGFTAGLAVARLRAAGVSPDSSALPIAVTGAAGAVGSFAVFLLAKAGFPVTAITGRTDEASYLRALGASDVVSRQEILTHSGKAIGSEKYAGVIDQAGGPLLATLLSLTASEGVVVSCGLAGGSDLPTTVLPFILRGISLLGVNSVTQPTGNRVEAWNHWAALADSVPFDDISHTIGLAEAGEIAPRVLAGATRGRVVVEIGA
jgi:acrylyl-CoA reductase (NADPH)